MKKPELTKMEAGMLEKLQTQGKIDWTSTKGQESAALNRLVKKGYAEFGKELYVWRPVAPF